MPLSGVWAEALGLLLLVAVLVFAMVAPRGLPEATVAVPAAGLLVVLGVVTPVGMLEQLRLLGPTVGFLAAILLLAHLATSRGCSGGWGRGWHRLPSVGRTGCWCWCSVRPR